MRVAVVGCGAIGGWLAARLSLAGVKVNVLARGATLAALRRDGLRLEEAGQHHVVQLQASDDPADLGQHDLVVLAVKGQHLAQAAPSAAALLSPTGKVLTAMNGVPEMMDLPPEHYYAKNKVNYRLQEGETNQTYFRK